MREKNLQFRNSIRGLLAVLIASLLALAGLTYSGLNVSAVAAGEPECTAAQSPKWNIHEGVTPDSFGDNAGVNYAKGLDTDMRARAFVQYTLLRENGDYKSAYVFTPYVSYLKPGTDEWSTPQEMKPENPGGLPYFLPPVKALDKTKDGWPATVLKRNDGVCQIPEAAASRIFEVPGGELVRDQEVMSISTQYTEGEDPSNAGNDTFRNNKGDLIWLDPPTGVNPEAKSKKLLQENKVAYVLWVEGKCADVAAQGAKCNDITYQNKPYAEIEILKYKNYVNELLKYIDGQTSPLAYYGSKPRWGYAYMGSVKNNQIYGYGPKKGQPLEYVSNMNRILPYCYDGPCLDGYWRGNIEPKKPTAVDEKGADKDVLQLPDDSRIKYYVVPESGKITSQNEVSGENKITDIAKYVDGKATVKVRAHVRGVCNVENLTPSTWSNEYSIDNSYCGFREWEFTFYGTQKVQLTPPTFDDATGTYEIPNIPGVKWQVDGKEVTPGTHKYPNKHGKISITAVPGTPNDPNVPIELVGNPGPHEHEYDLRTSVTPPVPSVEDAVDEGTWSEVVLPNDPSGFFSYGEPTYVDNSGKPFVEGTSKVVDGKQGVVRVKLTDAGLVEHNKLLCPAGVDCKVISDTELEFKLPLTYLKKTVSPVKPSVAKAATCGKQGVVNIPDSEFFDYQKQENGTKVKVTATLKSAFQNTHQIKSGAKTEWDLDIAGRLCVVDPTKPNPGPTGPGEMLKPSVAPQAPVVKPAAKCGNPGEVVIPESKLFSYTQTTNGTKVHVVAKLKDTDHYQLADDAKLEWDLDITGKACPAPQPDDNNGGAGGAGDNGGTGGNGGTAGGNGDNAGGVTPRPGGNAGNNIGGAGSTGNIGDSGSAAGGTGTVNNARNKANTLPRTGAAIGITAVTALLAIGAGGALRRKFAAK